MLRDTLIMPARIISHTPGDVDSEELCEGSLASTDADEQLDDPAGYHAPVHQFACFRESPRPCLNQGLVDQLAPLRAFRFLKYGSGSDHRPHLDPCTELTPQVSVRM